MKDPYNLYRKTKETKNSSEFNSLKQSRISCVMEIQNVLTE